MVTGDRKKISGKLAIKIHQCTFSGTNLTIPLGKMMVVVLGNSSFFILYWIAVPIFVVSCLNVGNVGEKKVSYQEAFFLSFFLSLVWVIAVGSEIGPHAQTSKRQRSRIFQIHN